MNILLDEHLQLLKEMNKQKVEFMLVGGVAVNFYGYPRPTGDLDVWLKPDNSNRNKLVAALNELQVLKEDISIIEETDFAKPLVFHIGDTPPFVVDFLTKMTGVRWEDAWSKRNETEVEGINISFISSEHLKHNKFLSGRPKDFEDIRQLMRIEELKKNK